MDLVVFMMRRRAINMGRRAIKFPLCIPICTNSGVISWYLITTALSKELWQVVIFRSYSRKHGKQRIVKNESPFTIFSSCIFDERHRIRQRLFISALHNAAKGKTSALSIMEQRKNNIAF